MSVEAVHRGDQVIGWKVVLFRHGCGHRYSFEHLQPTEDDARAESARRARRPCPICRSTR